MAAKPGAADAAGAGEREFMEVAEAGSAAHPSRPRFYRCTCPLPAAVICRTSTPLFGVLPDVAKRDTVYHPFRKAAAMDKSDAPRRWFGLWRAAERVPEDDPADLGTAFGLDLSLSELGDEGPPPSPPAPLQVKAGWMQRMAPRRRPAF
jgi:hypothetical protein